MSLPYLQPYLGLSNGLNTMQGGVGGAVGGWVELGRTTLGSNGDSISVSSFPDKRYYMILSDITSSGQGATRPRINNDSGSNYAIRYQKDGGTDVTLTSETYFTNYNGGFTNANVFHVSYLANYASKEKLLINHSNENENLGASNAPFRREYTGKWANTSDAVNRWDALNFGTGDFASGSEVVVLGYDPADTHTNNFWEELASVELGSAGDTIDSGTFTAKKYLWFQCYTKGANTETQFTLNSDSGSNYASRRSSDGGADSTFTSQTQSKINATGGGASYTACFMNGFIINNASNEKLVITHQIAEDAGTGAGNAPRRSEGVTKWANTSNQITSIQIQNNSSGDFSTGSILKVFGSD
jgi:hypothetical protein